MSPLVARAYFLRAFMLWIGTRALVSAVVALAGADPLHLSLPARLAMVALAVAAAVAQTPRLRERALLGNLGVSAPALLACFALAASLAEVALAVLVALVA